MALLHVSWCPICSWQLTQLFRHQTSKPRTRRKGNSHFENGLLCPAREFVISPVHPLLVFGWSGNGDIYDDIRVTLGCYGTIGCICIYFCYWFLWHVGVIMLICYLEEKNGVEPFGVSVIRKCVQILPRQWRERDAYMSKDMWAWHRVG